MILISHSEIDNIATAYADELLGQFLEKKKTITILLDILLGNDVYDLKDLNVTKSIPALKLILNQKELEIPKSTAEGKMTGTLRFNIDKNRVSTDKRSKRRKEKRYEDIKNQLDIIFNKNPLKELFAANITDLKTLNSAFDPEQMINAKVCNYFFDYQNYYDTLNKYIGEALGISCCPYCNRNYITYVFDKWGRIVGPTYDHFFNKSAYKYCSVSFFNLIPSCYVCNSNLKGSIDFELNTHLYPYNDEFGINAVFDFDFSLISSGESKKIIFKPVIKLHENISLADKLKLVGYDVDKEKEVTGSIKVFKLKEIYETHYDTVEEVHEKFDANSVHYVSSIKAILTSLSVSESEFYRFHFHNYYDSSDFHRRPLAKLTKDIYDKLKQMEIDAEIPV